MTVFLSIVALISAVFTIRAKICGNDSLQYVFKPLTMTAIILTACFNSSSAPDFYQKAVLAGLIFSTVGDVFLINDKKFFVHGLLSFLLGHLCYVAAFCTTPHLPSGVFYLIYVAFFLNILWQRLGQFKISVIVYAATIAAMSWLAFSRYLESGSDKTFAAFVGSIFFVASDSLLAHNKFRKPFSLAPIFILGTYFVAQWLIALSV